MRSDSPLAAASFAQQIQCCPTDQKVFTWPFPFKKTLPEYQEQEAYLLHLIYEKFLGSDLTAQEQAQLEEIDHVMLWYDLDGLLGEKQDGEPPKLHIELDYTVEPFAKVEAEYIRIFEKYSRSEK